MTAPSSVSVIFSVSFLSMLAPSIVNLNCVTSTCIVSAHARNAFSHNVDVFNFSFLSVLPTSRTVMLRA
jgi:hypothetical protein